MTIGERLGGRDNGLNFVRVILAGMVIASHTWPLGGYGPDPAFGGATLGTWAVGGFFAASGYLIAGSRSGTTLGAFIGRRAARIYPGFWVCLITTALLIAPLSVLVGGGDWSFRSAVRYIVGNASLHVTVAGIPATITPSPVDGAWNGSLWTLEFEAFCYAAFGLAVGLGRRRPRLTAVVLFMSCALAAFALPASASSVWGIYAGRAAWLSYFFAAGVFIWAVRSRIRASWRTVLLSVLGLAAVIATGQFRTLAALPVALLVLSLGARSPLTWGKVNDVSYGLYIYAFPSQQLLAWAGLAHHVPPAVFALTSVAVTMPFAWSSWHFVERPAIHRWRARERRAC